MMSHKVLIRAEAKAVKMWS